MSRETGPLDRLAAAYPTVFAGTDLRYSNCPPGWEPLVAALCARLAAEHPTVRCKQCKSKFGGLRFYVGDAGEAAVALIDSYERESYRLCERCGAPGKPNARGGWMETVCAEHARPKT